MLEVNIPMTSGMSEEQIKETMLRSTMVALLAKLIDHAKKGDDVSMEQVKGERVLKFVFKVVLKGE